MTEDAADERRTRYLLDENIARSIAVFLRERGHEAIESRDVVGPQAADRVIEWMAAQHNLIVVTHDRDFKSMLQDASKRQLSRIRREAMVLWLNVSEPSAVERLRACVVLVEHHIGHAQASGVRLRLIRIQPEMVSVHYWNPSETDTP